MRLPKGSLIWIHISSFLKTMNIIKDKGCNSIHFLVNKYNEKAIRAYAGLGYSVVGECHMFEQDFLCYEQKL